MMSSPSPKSRCQKKELDNVDTSKPLSSEELAKFKRDAIKRKKDRKQRQKIAEKEKDVEIMEKDTNRNNAALKHLAYFKNIVEFATAKNLPLAMGEHSIAIKEPLMPPKWSKLKAWVTKNLTPCCIISIGRKPKGWWTIRWAVVGDSQEEDLFGLIAPFGAYLTKTGWRTKAMALDADSSRLRDHYLCRLDNYEETIKVFVPEMFEVYRASLSIPRSTRTYRNAAAQRTLDTVETPVKSSAAYPVNGLSYMGGASPSGVALCEVEIKKGWVVEARWVGSTNDEEIVEDNELLEDCPHGDF
jgi:hypothetical protein